MLWRHGDVLIAAITTIPADASIRHSAILIEGEATGHAHRIEDASAATVWEADGELFVQIVKPTRIVHEEHKPIDLPIGIFRVWQQREYTPAAIRTVRD